MKSQTKELIWKYPRTSGAIATFFIMAVLSIIIADMRKLSKNQESVAAPTVEASSVLTPKSKTSTSSSTPDKINDTKLHHQAVQTEPSPITAYSTRIVQTGESYANLRSYPSTEVAVLMKVPNGTPVNIIDEQTNSSGQLWYKVQVNGQVGWLYSELLN